MIFVRKGPRYLFFTCNDVSKLANFLSDKLKGESTELSDALEKSRENDTIVFISNDQEEKLGLKGIGDVIYLPTNFLLIMEEIINNGENDIIDRVDSGAGQIVMRIPLQGKEVIREIEETYQAKPVNLIEAIAQGAANDTVLSFTNKPIRSKIKSLDLINNSLLIAKPVHILYQELRRDAVRYITHGLEQDQWYELKINIYESHDQYDMQYQRLSLVLADLEAGFILGESWTKDHAIALFSVIVYQIRLFTFLSPEEIKKILLSLEYNESGKRIVDYDLYYNGKKVDWYKINSKKKNIERKSLALFLRSELWTNLSKETCQKLKILEEQLNFIE